LPRCLEIAVYQGIDWPSPTITRLIPQAEVLVFENIEPSYIKRIAVPVKSRCQEYQDRHPGGSRSPLSFHPDATTPIGGMTTMAFRPVFCRCLEGRRLRQDSRRRVPVVSWLAASQKQRSIQSLHTEYLKLRPGARILEVSTKSPDHLGRALSAFHLKLTVESDRIPVENVFQASKVFAQGGPFTDLLTVPPHAAKRDPRLRESGPLQSFQWQNRCFPWNRRLFFTTGSTSQRLLRTQISLNVLWSTTALRILSSTPRSPSTVKRSRVPCLSLSITRVT